MQSYPGEGHFSVPGFATNSLCTWLSHLSYTACVAIYKQRLCFPSSLEMTKKMQHSLASLGRPIRLSYSITSLSAVLVVVHETSWRETGVRGCWTRLKTWSWRYGSQ